MRAILQAMLRLLIRGICLNPREKNLWFASWELNSGSSLASRSILRWGTKPSPSLMAEMETGKLFLCADPYLRRNAWEPKDVGKDKDFSPHPVRATP